MTEANETGSTPRENGPDAEVMRLAQAVLEADARRMALWDEDDEDEAAERAAARAFDEAVKALTETPATTAEGMAAKADVLRMLLHAQVAVRLDTTFEEEADIHDLMAMSLVRDLTARAA